MPISRQKTLDAYLVPPSDITAFRSLSDALHTSNGNKPNLRHRGNVLFSEGEWAKGIHILLAGTASVSISSSGGKTIILGVAQSGDVLGLNSTLRDCTYDVTAQTLEPCRTKFVSRTELMILMEGSHQFAQAVLTELSDELTRLTDRTRLLLLSQTSSTRLAKLLLAWAGRTAPNASTILRRIEKSFSHEEIAQMIGASRETVTRLLATLSRRHVIEVTADSIFIRDLRALETIAEEK
jgi:CRP/FNR family cyclic AMP-dependent transcriptional regulator